MPALRIDTRLRNRRRGVDVAARFVPVQPDLAAVELDQRWWQTPPGSTDGADEEDRDWNWEELCRDATDKDFWETLGLQTRDGRLQGAMIYSADAKSVLDPNAGAIYVDNLATAPWNRPDVTDSPEYSGVGSELLCRAVHHSHLLGLQGRVTLVALERAVDFYVAKGFAATGRAIEGLPLYELSPEKARTWLTEKGLVGNG